MTNTKQNKTSRDVIYEYLRQKMCSGDLLPGSTLSLSEITKDLDISKTPLREALIRLEAEGFVTIYPRSKVVINKLEEDDIEYLYDIIGSVEATMLRRGLPFYTESDLVKMESFIHNMRAALDEGDIRQYNREHRAIHALFAEVAPNLLAERVLTPLQNRLWDLPRHSFMISWLRQACDEHQKIVDALRAKDADLVVDIVKNEHWSFSAQKTYIQKTYFL